jgi:hypothetical protein
MRIGAHTEFKVELDQIYVEYDDALIGFYINEWFWPLSMVLMDGHLDKGCNAVHSDCVGGS